MPLIVICGYPSSGKTFRAKQIVKYFEERLNDSIPAPKSTRPAFSQAGGYGADRAATELSALNLGTAVADQGSVTARTQSGTPSLSTDSTTEAGTASSEALLPSNAGRKTPRNLRIHYISDHTCHLPRSIYATAKAEKDGRATLYSAVKRVLGKCDIVVLDSGNYIKGWRYQLHCEAKNAGTGSCVVHVGVTGEKCTSSNDKRLGSEHGKPGGDAEEDAYDKQVFDELIMRFEEPNPMARWDSPLFTVPWEDVEPPSELIWREMVEGVGKDGKIKVVRPNQAAMAPPASSSTHLYELDRTTQAILSQIQDYQRDHPDEGGVELSVSTTLQPAGTAANGKGNTLALILPTAPVSFPQLQRLRRQFISLHRQQMGTLGTGAIGHGGGGLSKERVGELFVAFLEAQWGMR